MADEPFATSDDLEARWQPLTNAQGLVAQTLLDDASDMIRNEWPDVDERLAAHTLTTTSLTRIVCAMVKRALIAGDAEGISQQAQVAGPFNLSQTFSNPNGNLYLTKSEEALLNGKSRKRAFAVDLAEPWRCWY